MRTSSITVAVTNDLALMSRTRFAFFSTTSAPSRPPKPLDMGLKWLYYTPTHLCAYIRGGTPWGAASYQIAGNACLFFKSSRHFFQVAHDLDVLGAAALTLFAADTVGGLAGCFGIVIIVDLLGGKALI